MKSSKSRRNPTRWLATGILAAVTLGSCSDPIGPGADLIDELPRPLSASESMVIERSNGFGVDLLREVLAVDERPNIVLSPLSASWRWA